MNADPKDGVELARSAVNGVPHEMPEDHQDDGGAQRHPGRRVMSRR
jgi:hypothetical protein